ncbi:LacI family DNA-binding transcriptional regulator [Arthrobacter sp. KK5.5]|uniref:LacI family DNA-binding transcriptional regulator n=1 Tax=Arthrobacter sp. KK5.5 TaxID=3373084 RepID=UPI003EE4B978
MREARRGALVRRSCWCPFGKDLLRRTRPVTHRFIVRDTARQAGVSDATVDRVLYGRPGVRRTTAGEVHRAIAELEAQQEQLELFGRRFLIDVVADGPLRFLSAVRQAIEAELPLLRPASRTGTPPPETSSPPCRTSRQSSPRTTPWRSARPARCARPACACQRTCP